MESFLTSAGYAARILFGFLEGLPVVSSEKPTIGRRAERGRGPGAAVARAK